MESGEKSKLMCLANQGISRYADDPIFRIVLLLFCLWNPQIFAANVSVTPSSGPGNALVSVTATGFLPDSQTNYYNTGFYADTNALIGTCFDHSGSAWANCTVMARMPTSVGPHVIDAHNSVGDKATTTYNVEAPTLAVLPAFGPAGTHITIEGKSFAAAANVGIYIDAALFQSVPTDESGNFSAEYTLPSLTPGFHDFVGVCIGVNASAPFTVTNCIGSVEITNGSGSIKHPDGSTQTLQPGTPAPFQFGDTLINGSHNQLSMDFMDGTHFIMSGSAQMTVDNYVYNPTDNTVNTAHYSLFASAFQYVSGLLSKKPNPDVHVETVFGTIGIRGTQFLSRQAPCSVTQEVYLIEGELAISPKATPSVTNIIDAPAAIFITSNNVTTNVLTSAMFESVSNSIFQAAAPPTLGPWLAYYFGCTNDNAAATADADPDGDGVSNANEFLAGTDPTSAASFFHILSATCEGTDVRVTWMCGGGRTNILQSATALNGTWSNLNTNVFSAGGDVTTNYLDAGSIANVGAKYYRVQLVQ
jgi:hypothetical protein